MDENQWLDRIYRSYSVDIYRFLLSLLQHPQRAEDVMQDTFLKAWRSRANAPVPEQEKAWLFRIARNTAYDLLRRDGRECSLETVAEAEGESVFGARELVVLIDSLKKPDVDIVRLKILGGLTHGEIAQVLRMSVHSVKKRYERAIHTLRLIYEEGSK